MRNQHQDTVVHTHQPEKKANPRLDHNHEQEEVGPADIKDQGDNNIRSQEQQESTVAGLEISIKDNDDKRGDNAGAIDVAMDVASSVDSPTVSSPSQPSLRSTSSPSSSAQDTKQQCVYASVGLTENQGTVGIDLWHVSYQVQS